MDVGQLVIATGDVWWASPDPATGREQSGRRPVLLISNEDFHRTITTLVLAVPITSVDRGWPNHVEIPLGTGLLHSSWAMTEQVRSISRQRLIERVGRVDSTTVTEVRRWIVDYIR